MTPNRRKEPFRYLFAAPESILFQLTEINGQLLETRKAPAELIDLNKSGCKLRTALDFKAESNQLKLTIELSSDDGALQLDGEIRWQNRCDGVFEYGIYFIIDEEQREALKAELRQWAALNKINVP